MVSDNPQPTGPRVPLDVVVERRDGDETFIRCKGELDLATSGRLEKAVEEVSAKRVVIDCSGVSFIDSTGVRILLRTTTRLDRDGVAWEIVPGKALARVAAVLGVNESLGLGSGSE